MTRQKEQPEVNPAPMDMTRIIEEIRKLDGLVQAGRMDEAIRVGENVLASLPDNVEIISLLADIHWQNGALDEAEKLLLRGLERAPNHAQLHLRMGDIARTRGQIDTAMACYRESVRLDPNSVDGHFQYGALLARKERYAEAISALQRALNIKPDLIEAHQLLVILFRRENKIILANVHALLHDHYQTTGSRQYDGNLIQDTYFLDTQRALEKARQGLLLPSNREAPIQQICYHHDASTDPGPDTLVHLPLNRVPAFFFDYHLRPPTTVDFDPTDSLQVQMALAVAKSVDRSVILRTSTIQTTVTLNIHQAPEFEPGEPLSVFMFVSRNNTVAATETNHIAKALARQGCRVHCETEKNGMEILDTYRLLKSFYAFNPHVTIHFNHANHAHLHADVFNIIWYQDPAQAMQGGKPPVWRKRDIILSSSPVIDTWLQQCGAREIHRQNRCFDLTPYINTTPCTERRKVVFVGHAHHHYLHALPRDKVEPIAQILNNVFDRGVALPDATLHELAARTQFSYTAITHFIYPYVVCHRSILWLCEWARELDIDLEIYGQFWDELPEVAPFHRGVLSNPQAVSAVYNQARYALITDPGQLQTQNLAEITACGCIPIVYDIRVCVPPPHWDDAILYFRTRDDLRQCLTQTPPQEPATIAQSLSCDSLAQRIVGWVRQATTNI
ncbi:MAG: tetratricopeptide repeat protein [Magnetococcales bacterium]|nr:tetratricopeptide repeat protein [Magnetococcales bacterium]MBF0321861.1 tetratricopeptide repeat protein [Magnetococcales bacterium]